MQQPRTIMELPLTYTDDLLGFNGGCCPDGGFARSRVYSLVYPPPGFFPFYGIGNGDHHGLYWPIDREMGPPIVAFSSHDAASLIPEHSSIEAWYQCETARSCADDNSTEHYRDIATRALGKPPIEPSTRGLAPDDFEELLSLDPKSPFYLCATADLYVANNEIDLAEERYRQSLLQLPEYVAAHFGLACVLRRQRRSAEATIHLRRALMDSPAFYGGSFWSDTALSGSVRSDWVRKSLMWLQRSGTLHETLREDPFISQIQNLTFQTGLAENPDIPILCGIVEEYAIRGAYSEAAQIWELVGNRAACETTSFRERYKLNPQTYGTRLAELLELSGSARRATLVGNMLKSMDKPDGLYL